jgi:catechol 2,3-dioxygenase-like lactoylglutathione lyase family enzyme
MRLDHVNVLTKNLDKMVEFYTQAMGFETGWRPGFDVGGAWLYQDGKPLIHLVDRSDQDDKGIGRIEHFAFSGADKQTILTTLSNINVPYEIIDIPGSDASSLNVHDPDGNHIEVIFGVLPPQNTSV